MHFARSLFPLGAGILVLAGGCSHSSTSSSGSCSTVDTDLAAPSPRYNAGPGTLVNLPLDLSNIGYIMPLGSLTGASHPVPVDHVYFLYNNSGVIPAAGSVPIYALADGVVAAIDHPGGEDKIKVQTGLSFLYFLDHVKAADGIAVGTHVTAGQVIAHNGGITGGCDLGVVNFNYTATGWVNPCRWGWQAHVDSPLKYFSGSTAATAYGLVAGTGNNKDGKLVYDQPGKLIGNWATQGSPQNQIPDTSTLMSFVYDNINTSQPRIGIGGTLSQSGYFTVQSGAPAFETVTTASGVVSYQLLPFACAQCSPGAQSGTLLVQLLDDTTLKAEIFDTSVSSPAFDAQAVTYVR